MYIDYITYTCMYTATKKQRNDRTVLVIDSEKHKSAIAIQLFVVVGDTSQQNEMHHVKNNSYLELEPQMPGLIDSYV